jgi:hypothetical protein
VQKVQQYLELYFSEDNVVTKSVYVPPDWVPGDIQLTAKHFAATKVRGVRVAKLADSDTSAIEAALGRINVFDDKVGGDGLTEEDEKVYRKELETAQDLLTHYKPLYVNDKEAGNLAGKDHEQMKTVGDQFVQLTMEAEANLYQRSYLNVAPLFEGTDDE